MNLHRLLAAAALSAALAGCSSPRPDQYAGEQPRLDIQAYFNGTLDAHGMFQDRSGAVVKRFVVVMRCQWQGDTGTLDEDFTYSDGSKQKRVWTLQKTAAGTFSATAPDVVGIAHGVVSGNALRWQYVLAQPVGDKVYNVDMEDWMFLIDGRVMLNRTAMSKFGVGLGSVTLSFVKR
ncbi:MAG: DUF3833 domain-containing protein [Pseudomonadota bacterium]|nr:DUF3833 domain-containing protein [Pseudomonadota bacterium]